MAKVIEAQLQKARDIIIEHVTIGDYLHRYGYIDADEKNLEKHKIKCPVHDDSSPSFMYDNEGKTCHCFGCHAKGSVVELHWNIEKNINEKYSIVKAIQTLAKDFQVKIPNMYQYELTNEEELKKAGTHRKRKRTDKSNPLKQKRKEIELKRMDCYQGAYSVQDMWEQSRKIDSYLLGEQPFEEVYREVKRVHQHYLQKELAKIMEEEGMEQVKPKKKEIDWE